MSATQAKQVLNTSSQPRVTLRNYFNHPFDSAIAAARTCYSTHIISADEITEKQRLKYQRVAALKDGEAVGW